MRKKHIFTVISLIAALSFTTYIALDTFVISHVVMVVGNKSASTENTEKTDGKSSGSHKSSDSDSETSSESASTGEVTTTETSYQDDNISITITTERFEDTSVYVADIQVSSAEYLQTAFAKSCYGKNVTDTTSDIADSVDAILAINGDYYGVQETGYVIRGGVLYRDEASEDQEDLVIYQDGSFEIINEDDITAEELLENGAENVLSFGPGLIENGEITVSENDEVAKAMTSNPRTAIGIIDDLHYVFVVADGRTDESEGLSLYELAQYMDSLGVTTAYNLDGGGSSTMVFNGTVINNPTTTGSSSKHHSSSSSSTSERSVSDIVYIGY